MSTVAVAVCSLLLFALGEAVIGVYLGRRRMYWWRFRRREQIRYQLADARNALVKMTLTNELKPRSATFTALYEMQTFVLRRPDQYELIQQVLYNSLWSRSSGARDPLDSEADGPGHVDDGEGLRSVVLP